MVAGTIYGVVLNDSAERVRLGQALGEDPYKAPPEAPVVYIRPRLCATTGGAPVPLPQGQSQLRVAATLALLIARDACRVSEETALSHAGGACLALDVSIPFSSYYRPPIARIGCDGFLPLGALGDVSIPAIITTRVDGGEVHAWSLERLLRSPAQLIAELSQFMTLRAGDLLLVGLPGDAPCVTAGQTVRVDAAGFAPIEVLIEPEALA